MERVQFGSLTLHLRRQLLANGQRVPLGQRALAILSVLVEARGEIVTKEELFAAVWPGVIVEENAIQVHVAALRKALGPEADRLTTIRGLGYRFDLPRQPARPLDACVKQGSVAILPFANLSGDASKAFIGEGIARELIATLARDTSLKVPSWHSVLSFKDRRLDIRAVARRLGVDAVVEGWVKFSADRVRVGTDLIDAASGFHIWSDRFERRLAELMALDGDLIASIAAALTAHLGHNRPKLSDS